ncbi:MAG TPA: enoyl-CoA hydratase/isomerase family protein [Thermoplasmata archaeon]|nr:enoyl-CoA hydratase/isomerase family protein [Thermoplasmata archaeon]
MTETRDLVRSRREGPIAILAIDNPPVNVISSSVLDALTRRLVEIGSDLDVRAVVLSSAAEKAFGAGADIREMANLDPAQAAGHGARGQAATRAIERLPLPVIAAVHGACLGGGCEIALACDFVIASEDARFGQPEIDLGILPGWGGTQRLPRRIGAARARQWIMTGRSVSAREAQAQGLVLEVVPRTDLEAAAIALARELAAKSATALAAAKRMLERGIDRGLDGGLAFELDLWKELFGTPDQREGLRAFLEKRPWTPAPRRRAGPP